MITAFGVPVNVSVAVWFAQTDDALAAIDAVGNVTAETFTDCDKACEQPPTPEDVTPVSV